MMTGKCTCDGSGFGGKTMKELLADDKFILLNVVTKMKKAWGMMKIVLYINMILILKKPKEKTRKERILTSSILLLMGGFAQFVGEGMPLLHLPVLVRTTNMR
jgi:hypothetical protein